MGCINLIDTTKNVALVVDIGGASTELSWVDVRRLKDESAIDKNIQTSYQCMGFTTYWRSNPI